MRTLLSRRWLQPRAKSWMVRGLALLIPIVTWTTVAGAPLAAARSAAPHGIATLTVATNGHWLAQPGARPALVECDYANVWTQISGASWIWANQGQSACQGGPGSGPGTLSGESVTLSTTFNVPGPPRGGVLRIAADNSANVYLNGRLVDQVSGYSGVAIKDFTTGLVQGKNTIKIVGTNAPGGSYNPAGVIASLSVTFANAGAWADHLPPPFTAGTSAWEEFDPLFTDTPAPPFMFQGTSYAEFKDRLGSGFFVFCAQGSNSQSRTCPDFAAATDPVLQSLLARVYPGASEDIGITLKFPVPGFRNLRLGRSIIGDGSIADLIGFDMFVGRWTAAAANDSTAQALMADLANYVKSHQRLYGTCPVAYSRHANINLRVACTAYWELEVYNNLYDDFVNLPKLCITAYGHGPAKGRLAAEQGCFLSNALLVAEDDAHDLTSLDPVPNLERRNPTWYHFTTIGFYGNLTPTCATSLSSFYGKAKAESATLRDSFRDFTSPELPIGPAPAIWSEQLQQIWDVAVPKPTAKGADKSALPSGTWTPRSISCPV